MEKKGYEIFHEKDRAVSVKILPDKFAEGAGAANYRVDTTAITSRLNSVKAAAKLFAQEFKDAPVDTVLALEGTAAIGAFMAQCLSEAGANVNQNIAIIAPDVMDGQLILGEGLLPLVINSHVLVLTATDRLLDSAVGGVRYYGGMPVGAAVIFGERPADVPVKRLFDKKSV